MSDKLEAFHDADRVLRQAATTFFDHLSQMCEGILVVDRASRIVWANDRWQRYLSGLGYATIDQVIGQPVESVVPNTLMHRVVATGQPIPLDILENQSGTYIVSRFPLRDEQGELIGAVGLILYDQLESLKPVIGRISRLQQELAQAKRALAQRRRTQYTFTNFVGNSPAALAVKSRARRAAALTNTVLLLGETGTGKELIAQAIHAASPRAAAPFIAVNMAAVPEALLEAEFFGVAPGAYTGADRRGREGKFALADGGTLFLDEIGDMPPALQAKLLRVLQEREFEPLGSNEVRRVDVRVIAASSLDLERRIAEGRFRADLYYRLNVLPIRLPALRERLDDLEMLCEHLLEGIAAEQNMPPKEIDRACLRRLREQPWPGNIRELRNTLEQAASFWDGMRLTPQAFAAVLPEAAVAASASAGDAGEEPFELLEVRMADRPALTVFEFADDAPAVEAQETLPARIARLEAESIREALRATGGNRVQAARRLGISRATLYQKLAGRPELSGSSTCPETRQAN